MRREYEHGADSYITKPFHSKVLLARIENLLKQRNLLKNVFQGTPSAEQEIEESHLDDRDKQFVKQLHDIIRRIFQTVILVWRILVRR